MKKLYFIIALLFSFHIFYSQKWEKINGLKNTIEGTAKVVSEGSITPNIIYPGDSIPVDPPTPPPTIVSTYHDTKGEISVSGAGDLNYSFPIALPPGIKSVAPQINLVYNSNTFTGLAGLGWNISGLYSITRIGKNIEKDGAIRGVKFDYSDLYQYNGQRLILTSGEGTYGRDGATYVTQQYSNIKIKSLGVSVEGASPGPESFEVTFEDGSLAIYGGNTNAYNNHEYVLTKWTDANGNYITYNYIKENNVIRISTIQWGGNTIKNTGHFNTITFNFKTRNIQISAYTNGVKSVQDRILDSVIVNTNGSQFRKYVIEYTTASNGALYEMLSKITEYNSNNEAANPIVFTRNNTEDFLITAQKANYKKGTLDDSKSIKGDFDGDGKLDFINYIPLVEDGYWEDDDSYCGSSCGQHWVATGVLKPAHSEMKLSGLDTNYNVIDLGTTDYTQKAFAANLLSNNGKVKQKQSLINYKEGTEPLAQRKLKFDTFFLQNNQLVLEYSKEIPSIIYDQSYIEPHSSPMDEYVEIDSHLENIKELDLNSDGISEFVLAIKNTTTRHNTYDPNCDNGGLNKSTSNNTTQRIINPCTITETDPPIYTYYIVNPNPNFSDNPYNLQLSFSEDIFEKGSFTDIDGDGLQEISIIQNSNLVVYEFVKNSNGEYKLQYKTNKQVEGDRDGAIFTDINGDGKTDLLIPYLNKNKYEVISEYRDPDSGELIQNYEYENRWNTYLSNGKIFLDKTSSKQFGMYNPKILNYGGDHRNMFETYTAKDINRDGLMDFIKVKSWVWLPGSNDTGDSSYGIEIYENRGIDASGLISYVKTYDVQPQENDNCANCSSSNDLYQPIVGNFRINNSENFLLLTHGSELLRFTYHDVSERARVTSILQGKIKTEVLYKTLDGLDSNFYSGVNNLQYPYTELEKLSQTKAVYKLKQGDLQQDFKYRGLVSNAHGRGLIGFRKSARTNWYTAGTPVFWSGSEMNPELDGLPIKQWTTKNYQDSFPTDFSNSNTFLLSFKEIQYLVQNFGQREVKLPRYNFDKDFLTGVIKETEVWYDSYFLPEYNETRTYSANDNSTATIYSSLSYFHNPTGVGKDYYIGRPKEKSEGVNYYNGTSTDSKLSKEQYLYNGNNLQYYRKYGNNTTDYIQEEYSYDGWGNVIQKITSSSEPTEIVKYTEKTTYETLGRFVSEKFDNINRKTTFTYNNLGQVLLETDFLGNTATNSYDNWGKLTQSVSSLSGTTIYQYTKYSDGSSSQTVKASDGDITVSYYDVKGQNVKSKTKAFEQDKYVVVETQYDAVGRKIGVSEPYFDGGTATDWNTIDYDEYSRPVTHYTFNGKSSSTIYNLNSRTIRVNENTGKFQEKTLDILGNIIKSKDLGGEITYSYNAAGQQLSAKYRGNEVKTTYDNWGRKTSFYDPSNGLYTYTYTPIGLLKIETSPKGSKEYTYNDKGQLTNVVESATDGSTAKNYNIAYNATTGLVTGKSGSAKTASSGTAKTFTNSITYDTKGRITANTENFTSEGNAKIFGKNNIVYDALNRITSYTQYATSSGVTTSVNILNAYSTWSGDLYQVKQATSNKILWELQTTNAKGQVLTAKLGAIQVQNTYGSDGFLTNAKHYSATAVIMDNDYNFTGWKNELNSRYNRVLGISETFTYDQNNRLTNWTNPRTGQQSNNTYDDLGRITYNDQVGSIQYNNSKSIYRASGITLNANGIANYDNQGTPTSSLIQNITYNENNDPVKIDGVKGDYAFEYGLSENRQIMYYGGNFSDNSGARYIKYYSEAGDAEIIKDTQTAKEKIILYIGGTPYESNIVYLKNFTETSGSFKFLHKDYLGSIMAISDEAGNALERRHYDAWGIITHLKVGNSAVITDRNIINSTEWLIDRGYTSHEHLKAVELIHMNGRLYDPLLRRFLNADENIQDPTNTQNYNKYSYVLANPLLGYDVDGEELITIGTAIVIGMLIGGAAYTLGVLITTGSLDEWNVFDFAKSVIIGGISGAATFGIGEIFKVGADGLYIGKFAKSLKGFAEIVQAGMHGVSQGLTSMLGSDGAGFFQGFVSGALGSLGAKGWAGMVGEKAAANGSMIAFGALSGGIGAELTGGNFFKGFVQGGIVAGLNHTLHSMSNKASNIADLQKKGFTEEQIKNIYDNYLKPEDVSVDKLIEKIGGPLEQEYNKQASLYKDLQGNTCALRLSYAMNKAGFSVNGDYIGGGGLRYYTSATRMTMNYLNNFGGQYTYGKPYKQSDVTPIGIIAQYRNANSVLHVDVAYNGNYGTNHYQNWKTVNWMPVK